MVLFKNFHRSITELLNTDFCHEKPWTAEIKHGSNNPTICVSSTLQPNNTIQNKSQVKYVFKEGSLDVDLENNHASVKGSFSVPSVKNLTLGFAHNYNLDSKDIKKIQEATAHPTNLSAEYLHNPSGVHVQLNINPFTRYWDIFNSVTFCSTPKFCLHLGSSLSGTKSLLKNSYSVGTCIVQKTNKCLYTGTLFSSFQPFHYCDTIMGSLVVRKTLPGAPEFGTQIKYIRPYNATQINIASSWHFNPCEQGDSYNTLLKLKLSHDAKLSAVLKQNITPTVKASIGTQLSLFPNSFQFLKYGFKIEIAS